MSLSHLLTAVWFFLVGLVWALQVNISAEVLGWIALAIGVLMALEASSVVTYTLPARRRGE